MVVKCEEFVLVVYCSLVFFDIEILLLGGENMLVLKIEVCILQEVNVKKYEYVLEIGVGLGYMVVLLVYKVCYVMSVEILLELKVLVEQNLLDYGVVNVDV